ncbi:putative leucine-tRNA ligase [Bacillus phage vB_BspP_Dartukuta]|nr:putative leucine-tRNA ligase [Bacillus phage vB_BspP_Dartukuta]
MNTKVICRKTRRPNDQCATEKQQCKRCGALLERQRLTKKGNQ